MRSKLKGARITLDALNMIHCFSFFFFVVLWGMLKMLYIYALHRRNYDKNLWENEFFTTACTWAFSFSTCPWSSRSTLTSLRSFLSESLASDRRKPVMVRMRMRKLHAWADRSIISDLIAQLYNYLVNILAGLCRRLNVWYATPLLCTRLTLW